MREVRWLILGCFVAAGCSAFGSDSAPPQDGGTRGADASDIVEGGGEGDAGADVAAPPLPFCASREPSATVICEDFDEKDGGNDFLGWTPQLTGGAKVEYSTAAYSPPYAMHATIPAKATYAQAYLLRYADLPRAKRYRVSFMVRGNHPVNNDSLFFTHVFFDVDQGRRYLTSMRLSGPSARPFRIYMNESTQEFPTNLDIDHQTAAPPFEDTWTPVELTFDFGASPAKATYTVGTSKIDFVPLISTGIQGPDLRLGIEAYNVPDDGLDVAADLYYDNLLFEALP